MDGSTSINDPINGFNGSVKMAISVGDRDIAPWTITNWAAPDTTPSFTPITEVLNRTPGGSSVIGPIGLTDFNQPITISATAPLAFNEFGFATGENVGDVLFSVNGALLYLQLKRVVLQFNQIIVEIQFLLQLLYNNLEMLM